MVNFAHITGCGRSQASLEESLISVISGKTISNSSSSSSISLLLQSKFNTPSFFFFFFHSLDSNIGNQSTGKRSQLVIKLSQLKKWCC